VDLLTPPLYPVTVTIFISWLSGYLVFKITERAKFWRSAAIKIIWLSGYLVIWL
jgi:hypothetical protein